MAGDGGSDVGRLQMVEGHNGAVDGVWATFFEASADHGLEAIGVLAVIVQEAGPLGEMVEVSVLGGSEGGQARGQCGYVLQVLGERLPVCAG
jgi:hypothetical protein